MKWWVLAASFAAVSCTIVALSDDVEQAGCTNFNDCEVLNIRELGGFDRCNIWQCRANRCVYAPTDVDNDGYGIPVCSAVGVVADCEDMDPERYPGATERCDGKDNDCDLAVDEGMLRVARTTVMTFPEPVRELDYVWNTILLQLGVVAASGDDRRISFASVDPRGANTPRPLVLSRSETPLSGNGLHVMAREGRFAATLTEAASPHRILVGSVLRDQTAFVLNVVDEPLRQFGLRCADSEACASRQDPPLEVPASTRPALAALDSFTLAAYARKSEPSEGGCHGDTPQPVLINLLGENFLEFQEATRAAVQLGETRSFGSPALLPIDVTMIAPATEQFGWLAAYIDADGAVVIRHVRQEVDRLLANPGLTIDPPSQPYVEVRLALGATSTDRVEIGIAAQEGCGDAARIRFGVLSLSWDLDGRTELRMYRELRQLGDDERGEQPELAYNAVQASWGVVYVNDSGLFARVLTRDGVSRGATAYQLRDVAPVVRDFAIASPIDRTLGAFAVYSYVESQAQSPAYSLEAAYLGACAP